MQPSTHSEEFDVWPGEIPDAELWRDAGPELERPSWENSRLVRNVGRPTLTTFLPDPAIAIGTGVIVCPGGAFHFLMIDKEGTDVANWLTARGVAAFVLKYRVLPTPDDDAAFETIAANPTPHRPKMDRVRPMTIADGLQAVRTLRGQTEQWAIDPDRIGIIGFSAGAYVAVGAATKFDDPASRPSFAASVYGEWWDGWIPRDAPPIFITAAADDPLIAVRSNASHYESWLAAGCLAELHLYSRGGHGFALRKQGLPSDGWIDRYWEWLGAEGFVPTKESQP